MIIVKIIIKIIARMTITRIIPLDPHVMVITL